MSKTPRTDAVVAAKSRLSCWLEMYEELAEHARQLERELTQVRGENEALQAQVKVYATSRRLMAKAPPRDTCPGCFAAIYEGAADQGAR